MKRSAIFSCFLLCLFGNEVWSQTIEITSGSTNELNIAGVAFKMKNLGTKKLKTKYLGEFYIDNIKYDLKNCIASVDDPPANTKGIVIGALRSISAGDHIVGLTVILDDDSTVNVLATVNFKKP